MQRASDGLAGVVREVLRASSGSRPDGRVLLLVGSGNNGGDALYAGASLARELVPGGGAVTVVPAGRHLHDAGLAAARAAGATVDPLEPWCDPVATGERLAGYDVVLDGLVGTGTSGAPGLRGDALRVVRALLTSLPGRTTPTIVAVDVPSGIGTDDGSLPEPPLVLPADVTVTFGGHKAGLLVPPASLLAGRVVLVDIGLGPDLAAMPPAITTD